MTKVAKLSRLSKPWKTDCFEMFSFSPHRVMILFASPMKSL